MPLQELLKFLLISMFNALRTIMEIVVECIVNQQTAKDEEVTLVISMGIGSVIKAGMARVATCIVNRGKISTTTPVVKRVLRCVLKIGSV